MASGAVPACKWVRLACKRQLDDLARVGWAYRFDVAKAERACRFIEHLPHIKGPKGGQPFILEPWQCWIVTTLFGWVHATGSRAGRRRFRRSYKEIPRGNGKSALSAGVGLYLLSADGEAGAEVYSVATTRDQAKAIFETAQAMVRRAPEFAQTLGMDAGQGQFRNNIFVERTVSKFEALSADAHTLDGLNIHGGLIDELHAHKTRAVHDVIETGTGKRDQSLLWEITTAGSDRSGICYEIRGYTIKVLTGVVVDDSHFGVIYTIDDEDDWVEESSWRKANPNWGVSVMPEVIGQLAHKAMQMPSAQNNFKTKHLNAWVNADVAWMDMAAWDRAGNPALEVGQFDKEPCFGGLDLASKVDIAAKARLFTRNLEGVLHYYAFLDYYLPEAAVEDGRNSQYQGWALEGRLKTTPGEVLDFDVIEQDLLDDQSRFDLREVPYDPWQALQLAQRMTARGLPMVEYRNIVANFSAPMKELEALVRSGRFHHNGDPILAWMVSNVVCHMDAKENIYPRKERAENKIDGVIALLSALGRAMHAAPGGSVYDTRGILTL